MEEIKTMSPETRPYWNYVKDASLEVRKELAYFLVNVNVPMTEAEADVDVDDAADRLVFPKTREDEKEILRRAFRNIQLLKEGKLETYDARELLNEL